MKKKLIALSLAVVLVLALAACTGGTEPTQQPGASNTPKTETVKLKVAASATPHAEILAQVKDELAEQGIDLVVTEYGDYVIPNTAVEDGDEDVNYFQHQPYLDQFNAENNTHLVSVAAIHYEPLGIYPGKTAALADLPDGALIGVPNDATNEARALQLLEAQGLIKVREGAGLNATPNGPGGHQRKLCPSGGLLLRQGRPGSGGCPVRGRPDLCQRHRGEGGQREQRGGQGPGEGPSE